MRRLSWLPVAVLCSGILLSAVGGQTDRPQGKKGLDKRGASQKQAPTRQKAPGKSGPKGQRQPKTVQASNPRVREQRLAKNHITSAFPRTRSLLGYLEQRDRKAFDTLLDHSQKITRRLENEALQMARQHHPELSRLLLRLRNSHPRTYQTAIRELVGDHQRIQRSKSRGKADHDLALTEWRLRSQARLIAAQMTVKNAPELTRQLSAVLTQEAAAKRRQMQLEIQRYQRQIERLEERLKQDPAKSVRSQLKRIQRQAQTRTKTDKRRRK